MAEQNMDETNRAAARRAARPFTGRAGTPSPTQSPILRPAAPASRPVRGPFAPPGGRTALGSTGPVAQPAKAPESTPGGVVGITVAREASAPQSAMAPAMPEANAAPMEVTFDLEPAEPMEGAAVPAPTVPSDAHATDDHLDAIGGAEVPALGEAFERLGDVRETLPALDTPSANAERPLLDEASLGSVGDAAEAWADELTALPEPWADAAGEVPAEPARALEPGIDWAAGPGIPAADDVVAARPWSEVAAAAQEEHARAVEPAFAEVPEAAIARPEELAADPSRAPWADPLLAEYAPYMPAPAATDGAGPHAEEVAVVEPVSPTPELRVAEALDRLANRVRRGEIPVSSVAPEATDAAVLASVLVALLGGPSSR